MPKYSEVKIGKLAEFINGYAFKPSQWSSEGKKIIRIQNLTDPNKPFNLTEADVPQKYIVKSGDILVSWSATIDIFEWKGEDALLNQHIFKVEFNEELIHKNYFVFALKTTIKELSRKAHGSTMKHVVKSDFTNHRIPLPSLSDQIKIAQLLQKAESLIKTRKDSIALLDELVQSVFQDMFGDPVLNPKNWEEEALGNLTTKIGSGSTPKGGKEAYKEEGISLIRSLNVYDNEFKYKNLAFIDEQQAAKLSNVSIETNDVLLNITGASVARVTVVPESVLPARVNQHVSILRTNPKFLNQDYLCHLLISQNFKKKLLEIATSAGATREAITKAQLEFLDIPVPDIEIQTRFSEIVVHINSLKEKVNQNLSELENLFGGLTQKAFAGELELEKIDFMEEGVNRNSMEILEEVIQ